MYIYCSSLNRRLNAIQGEDLLCLHQSEIINLSFLACYLKLRADFLLSPLCMFSSHLCPLNELFLDLLLLLLLIKGCSSHMPFICPHLLWQKGTSFSPNLYPHSELLEFSSHDDTLESILASFKMTEVHLPTLH